MTWNRYDLVEILAKCKEKTAFTVGPLSFCEYKRMPFRLTITLVSYKGLMQDCFVKHNLQIFIFIDDVIVSERFYEENRTIYNLL